MAACEECWAQATRWAAMFGGNVVDHYRDLLRNVTHDPRCVACSSTIDVADGDDGLAHCGGCRGVGA